MGNEELRIAAQQVVEGLGDREAAQDKDMECIDDELATAAGGTTEKLCHVRFSVRKDKETVRAEILLLPLSLATDEEHADHFTRHAVSAMLYVVDVEVTKVTDLTEPREAQAISRSVHTFDRMSQ